MNPVVPGRSKVRYVNTETIAPLPLCTSLVGLLAGCKPLSAAQQLDDAPATPEGGAGKSADKAKKMSNEIPMTQVQVPQGKEIATVAGGCFWCVDAVFTELKGVEKVVSGYSGGKVANPSYEEVCNGTTDHAEAVQITFDPKVIAYRDLLRNFFTTHDPTTLNRQGHDVGTQYRSAIFYHSPEQKKVAEEVIKEITTEKLYKNPIVTEVTPFKNFYAAEAYHRTTMHRTRTRATAWS
jgi:peptide-methionine (S)-S-oxide reductase